MKENIWECKIGGLVGPLPPGADAPMREAVQRAFFELTGVHAEFVFSGWAGELGALQGLPGEREETGGLVMASREQALGEAAMAFSEAVTGSLGSWGKPVEARVEAARVLREAEALMRERVAAVKAVKENS